MSKLERAVGNLPGEYRNEDGKISVPDNHTIGTASFVLNARQGLSASSLAIDQKVLETICGVSGGCSMSIQFEAAGLRVGETTQALAAGPCALIYNKTTGAWSRGSACGDGADASGVDGDGTPASGGGGAILAAIGGGCLLADANIARTVGAAGDILGPDNARGLYLIAAPTLLKSLSGRFKCQLRLE
ncbi:MAG: hypothetical protein ABI459_00240 [Deltaproteobacteria bacterium]